MIVCLSIQWSLVSKSVCVFGALKVRVPMLVNEEKMFFEQMEKNPASFVYFLSFQQTNIAQI